MIRARILEENPEVKMSPAMALSITKHISKKIIQILQSDVDLWSVNRDMCMIFAPLETKKLCEEFKNGVGVSYDYLLRKKKLSRNAAKFLKRRHKEILDEREAIRPAMWKGSFQKVKAGSGSGNKVSEENNLNESKENVPVH